MQTDIYGRQILNEDDLCNLFLQDPTRIIKRAYVDKQINFNDAIVNVDNVPKLEVYQELDLTLDQFDKHQQNKWLMPTEYAELDIAKYLLDLCTTDHELQRVGEELLLFQERDMFPLLCYCKYLVDTMRTNKVIWGVGRGSSVSSYVLYLIGVHRINSLHYDLSIDEFLK
jgi:DNA polymerase III alpha subunit